MTLTSSRRDVSVDTPPLSIDAGVDDTDDEADDRREEERVAVEPFDDGVT